jgi:hypothetical protein
VIPDSRLRRSEKTERISISTGGFYLTFSRIFATLLRKIAYERNGESENPEEYGGSAETDEGPTKKSAERQKSRNGKTGARRSLWDFHFENNEHQLRNQFA